MTSIAVVTGTSSGLGASLATALLDRGWTVVGSARSLWSPEDQCLDALYHHVQGDIRNAAVLDDIAATATSLGNPLKLLIHNASSGGRHTSFENCDANDWETEFRVGLFAPARLTRLLLGPLESSGGRAIFVGSSTAGQAAPGFSDYSACKAAVGQLAATLRAELAGRVEIEHWTPGLVETPMLIRIRAATVNEPVLDEWSGNSRSGKSIETAMAMFFESYPELASNLA